MSVYLRLFVVPLRPSEPLRGLGLFWARSPQCSCSRFLSLSAPARTEKVGGVGTPVPDDYLRRLRAERERTALVDRILRVDHAGELGADRIYAGQYAVLGKTPIGPTLKHMWEQEQHHRATFEELLPRYRARPTIMIPIWNVAAYALGVGTALLGKEAAMACTVAVETVIADHYNNQIRALIENGGMEHHKELLEIISKFRDDEMEHHDCALEHDAEKAPAYKFLSQVIKGGCHVAIWISERI